MLVCVRKSIWHVKVYDLVDASDIPKSHHLLPHLNPDWFYLSGTGLPSKECCCC